VTGPVVLDGALDCGDIHRAYSSKYPEQVAVWCLWNGSTPLQNRDARLNTAQEAGVPLWASILMMRTVFDCGLSAVEGRLRGAEGWANGWA